MNDELKLGKKTISSGGRTYRKEILLNKDNIKGNCPYCGNNVIFTWINPYINNNERSYILENNSGITFDKKNFSWAMCLCPECDKCILVKMECDRTDIIQRYSPEILPSPFPKKSSEEIPEDIRQDFDEAKRCFSVDCYNASSIMTRKSIEKTLLEQGASKNKNLKEKIDELVSNQKLTKDIGDFAHTIRFVGNDGAHDDEKISQLDAKETLELAEQIFQSLYINPARNKRLRKIHEKVKK